MAKITYEFDYFEEQDTIKVFQKSNDFFDALWEIDQMCRTEMKHCDDTPDKMYDFLELIRDIASIVHED